MTAARPDDEVRELMALHAVGALTDTEQQELELAMADRPDLRKEMDALRALTASTMADAVSEPPPVALRAGILDAIAATPQLPPVERPAEPAEPPIAPVVPIDRARRRRWLSLGAVAAAVIALVVGVAIVAPFGDSGEGDEIAAVLEADDATEIPMPGELPGLMIVHSAGEDAAVLLAPKVPVPDGDRVYELWAVRGGTPERFATFRPNDDGQLSVYAPGLDPASAEQWAITEEPAGGSDAPTSAILNETV